MHMYSVQGWACGPSAFHSEFYSYMCRLVAIYFKVVEVVTDVYFSKPMRLLHTCICISVLQILNYIFLIKPLRLL